MKEAINTQFTAFKARCEAFFKEKLKPIGYTDYTCDDLTQTFVGNATPFFNFAVSRIDPRTGRNIWALFMDYCPTDKKPAMLYENFESLSDIPSEYGDLRHPNMPAQPPQFVYGIFSRLGDALNSMLKGCSIDLRKPIELYY